MSQRLIDHSELQRREAVVRPGDRVLIEKVGDHLAAKFGSGGVIHDHDSRWVHVDVFVHAANATRPVTVVATCGMAERPLTTIANERVWTELVAFLPPSWPTTDVSRPEISWPFSLLRWLARFPHKTGTGFAPLETMGPIPYEPADQRPYPFEAALFLEQPIVAPLAMVGREIRFLAMCPIYADELAWMRAKGANVLLDAFAARGANPLLVDAQRASFAPP